MSTTPPAGSPPVVPSPPASQPAAPADPSAGVPAVEPGQPPVREPGFYQAAVQDERRKRQELQARLDAIEAERAEAARKKLEQDGEFKQLASAAEAERDAAKLEAVRARRDAVLARRGISEADAGYAHYCYDQLPEADRPPFAEWVDAARKEGGALHRITQPVDDAPKGARGTGKTSEPIPASILAEARRRKDSGGALYAGQTVEQVARSIQARRARNKKP